MMGRLWIQHSPYLYISFGMARVRIEYNKSNLQFQFCHVCPCLTAIASLFSDSYKKRGNNVAGTLTCPACAIWCINYKSGSVTSLNLSSGCTLVQNGQTRGNPADVGVPHMQGGTHGSEILWLQAHQFRQIGTTESLPVRNRRRQIEIPSLIIKSINLFHLFNWCSPSLIIEIEEGKSKSLV